MLLASAEKDFAARVVMVTSGAHRNSQMNFENLNLKGIYDPRLAYSQSKTANILMANQIERLYGSRGLHALSVHPGCILTGLQKHDDPAYLRQRMPELEKVLKSLEQGAATTVWAAVGKVWEGKGMKYLEDMREGHETETVSAITGGYRSFIFDEEAEKKLWDVSCEMVGMSGLE